VLRWFMQRAFMWDEGKGEGEGEGCGPSSWAIAEFEMWG
jgi:hypothetical protein